MRKLEIGSGHRPQPGYEHLDIDATCPDLEFVGPMDDIPVDDETFDELLSIHSIEHTSWRNVLPTLQEWFRVLKPGGRLEFHTPNLRYILSTPRWRDDYERMTPDEKFHICVDGQPIQALWMNFKLYSSTGGNDKHEACLDEPLARALLGKAGFHDIRCLNEQDTLVMEARK